MYRAPRGTTDILPTEQKYWRYIETTAAEVAHSHGYRRIGTPAFEDAGLFVRTIGQDTDIVQKEMYTFQDRGNDFFALRPEGTTPVCRAYIEHGMNNLPQPVRLYYFCPVFRHERPQAGRHRQHHQFGLESLGDASSMADAEVVSIAWTFLSKLGLRDIRLLINSIGDQSCRPKYLEELRGYYKGIMDHLCVDCRSRYTHNPLRLLDCKQEACRQFSDQAIRSSDHLCTECAQHWGRFQQYLDAMDIPYEIDHRLVRGLDYYTRTVFEIQPAIGGSQSTICGGGRYDGLMQEVGGKPTPGVGFGTGIERMILNLKLEEVPVPEEAIPPVVIAYTGDDSEISAIKLAKQLRSEEIAAMLAPKSKSLKGQMRHASALGASTVLILGDQELANGTVTLRDMVRGEQLSIIASEVPKYLKTSL